MHKSVLFSQWATVDKNKPQNTGNKIDESWVQVIFSHNQYIVPGRKIKKAFWAEMLHNNKQYSG